MKKSLLVLTFTISFIFMTVSCNRDPLKDDSYDSKVILMPVNRTVQIDDYNVKTIDLKLGPAVGRGPTKYRAESGAVLALYTFVLSNASKETKNINFPIFELIDSRGNRYSPSGRALAAYSFDGGNVYDHLSQLHPGIDKQMTVIFEAPKSIIEDGCTIAFSTFGQKGFILTVPGAWSYDKYQSSDENKLIHERYYQMLILREKIPEDLQSQFNQLFSKLR